MTTLDYTTDLCALLTFASTTAANIRRRSTYATRKDPHRDADVMWLSDLALLATHIAAGDHQRTMATAFNCLRYMHSYWDRDPSSSHGPAEPASVQSTENLDFQLAYDAVASIERKAQAALGIVDFPGFESPPALPSPPLLPSPPTDEERSTS